MAISEIAKENTNLHSILIDEKIIEWRVDAPDELRSFPYHYDQAHTLDLQMHYWLQASHLSTSIFPDIFDVRNSP